MEIVNERCCGLDVHKRTVMACTIVPGTGASTLVREVRTFSTMTDDLLALADWLVAKGVTHVVLESTGAYWKPVWNLLEAHPAASAAPTEAAPTFGKSGRAMLAALVAGGPRAEDAHALAGLAQRRLRHKLPDLERALAGRMGPHQRFLLAQQLAHIDFLDAAIERASAEIRARLQPHDAAIARLDALSGVARRTPEIVVAEVGVDLRHFASARHLASWAGLCPGNRESAGKRLSGRTRKGNHWLRTALVEAAHAAARTRGTYLATHYRRLAARRGAKRAAVAVAHTLLVIIYHVLTEDIPYRDLGATSLDQRDRAAVERRLIRRREALGHTVTLSPLAA